MRLPAYKLTQPTTQTVHVPAPVGGLNSVAPASMMPPGDCLALWNMVPSSYGLKVRPGYREHVTGLDGEVRTLMSYKGSLQDGTQDYLFATTSTGIWDVSTSTAAPTRVYDFTTIDATSGYGNAVAFVNAAGTHFLVYCDESCGMHVFNETTGTWAKVVQGGGGTEIDGVDPGTFVHVLSWKNRLWFVQKNTDVGWYLDVNALYGTAAAFHFGPKFKAGGHLVSLHSWTVDGGAGIDDQLVALSSGGDVVIYAGTDPSGAWPNTFMQRGVWYCGGVPRGRRIASDFGGDLLILTQLGVVPLSRLVAGASIRSPDLYATAKIQNLFTALMTERRDTLGWSIRLHPEDMVLVTLPTPIGGDPQQLAMSGATKGWASLTGVEMLCGETWNGLFYFGDSDGRICINDGYADNVQLTGAANATAIQWSMLTAYQTLGTALRKRAHMIRPSFLTDGTNPQYTVKAKFDYDLTAADAVSWVTPTNSGYWDSAVWDWSVWGSGTGVKSSWAGTTGLGAAMAVHLSGASKGRCVLGSLDVAFDVSGGPL